MQDHIRKARKEIASGEMYATFDRHSPASLGADVLSLSWKGDAGRGWLAAGNSGKTVGVTYTEAKDWAEEDGDSTELATPAPEVLLERQGMRRNFWSTLLSTMAVFVCEEVVLLLDKLRTR